LINILIRKLLYYREFGHGGSKFTHFHLRRHIYIYIIINIVCEKIIMIYHDKHILNDKNIPSQQLMHVLVIY